MASAGSTGWRAAKVVAHGIVGGTMSVLRGGKFGSGFSSGAFAAATSGLARRFPTMEGRVAAAAVAGGIGAELGGGKFANGAVTGAFQRLYNHEAHYPKKLATQAIVDNATFKYRFGFFGAIGARISKILTFSFDVDFSSREYDVLHGEETYRHGLEARIDVLERFGFEFQLLRRTDYMDAQGNVVDSEFTFSDGQFFLPGETGNPAVFNLRGFFGGKLGLLGGMSVSIDPVGYNNQIAPIRHNIRHMDNVDDGCCQCCGH